MCCLPLLRTELRLSGTARLTRLLLSAESPSLSVSFFLSVQFSDVLMYRSRESQGILSAGNLVQRRWSMVAQEGEA